VFLLQQLFEWLVLMPARVVALYAIVPVCSLPPLAAIGSWFWVVHVIDGRHNGRPANWRTFVAATLISSYVLLVTGIAIYYYFIHSEWLSDD
jgi:hypothetical protein